jgi:putative hemolysin
LAGGRSLGAPYGDFFIWEQDFTWPKDDRSHTIKTIVDVNNTIKESNEANNELSGSFQAKCPLPAKCYPDLPAPKLAVTGTEEYEAGGQQWTRYWMSVTNRSAFPDELFELAPDLPPCGLNKNASRTWVDIYAKDGTRLSGFCALSSSEGLDRIWFAVPRGQLPPDFVYITLWDRRCNITYTSNLAPTRGLPPPCMSRTRFTDSVGRDVAKYIVGDTVYVTVEDCDENRTPGVVDTVKGALTVENPRTKVMVDLVETEPDTGVFLSKPITIGELGSGAMLEVKEGDTLKATYKDPDDPRDVSTDEVYIYVPPPICPPSPCSPFGFGCANPASVYCTSLGYELEIVEEPEGQVGMCIFPDGSKCEEWSFFKGECGQQFSYCERFGGGRIDPTPGYCDFALSECAVCILPDGSRCLDWDYCAGECP